MTAVKVTEENSLTESVAYLWSLFCLAVSYPAPMHASLGLVPLKI